MSSYAKFIINGVEAAVFNVNEIPLSLKKRISTLEGNAAGSFTRSSLTIPATKTNKAILTDEFGFLPFRIEINGAIKLSGFLQVTGENLTNDCYNCTVLSYDLALRGGNASWLQGLKDCTLDEVTDATDIFDRAEIQNGFNADPDAVESGFTFFKWKEWKHSRRVSETLATPPPVNRQLESPSYEEATPFLFIKPLVERMFNLQGFTIISNFFNTNFFKRLIWLIPLPDKLPQEYSEAFLNFEASRSILNVPIQGVIFGVFPYDTVDKLPPQNPTAWDGVLYEYTCKEAGFYEVEFGHTFGPQTGTFEYSYIAATSINGAIIPPSQGGAAIGAGDLFGPELFPTGETQTTSTVFQLEAGDVIRIETIIRADTPYDMLNNFVRITGEATRTIGLEIDFKTLISKYDCLPLLKDLEKAFKLTFDTNPDNKTVIIEPSDLYRYTERYPVAINGTQPGYYSINDFKDYTQKIDLSRNPKNKRVSIEGFINYRYLSDDEETINYVEEGQKLGIYEALYNAPNGSDKGKVKTIETEFFAKTLHIRDNLARYPETDINPQFPSSYPQNYVLDPTAGDNDAEYDISPRILFFAGQRDGLDGYIEIYENPGVPEPLPAAFMVNYNDSSGLDPSLSWAAEKVGNNIVPGLVERFNLQCIARLIQRERKEAFVLTNAVEEDNFSFRQKAVIGEKKYIIQNIESTNPLQGIPDKFLFVRDGYATENLKDDIDNTLLSGVVSLFVK
jgi:hypothetical protein